MNATRLEPETFCRKLYAPFSIASMGYTKEVLSTSRRYVSVCLAHDKVIILHTRLLLGGLL